MGDTLCPLFIREQRVWVPPSYKGANSVGDASSLIAPSHKIWSPPPPPPRLILSVILGLRSRVFCAILELHSRVFCTILGLRSRVFCTILGLRSRVLCSILGLRSRVFCTILGLCSRVFFKRGVWGVQILFPTCLRCCSFPIASSSFIPSLSTSSSSICQ